MFQKYFLKKRIAEFKKLIADTEQKRSRSQAALVDAILTHKTPSDADVEFFNKYTAEIDGYRAQMHELLEQLNNL